MAEVISWSLLLLLRRAHVVILVRMKAKAIPESARAADRTRRAAAALTDLERTSVHREQADSSREDRREETTSVAAEEDMMESLSKT